MSYYFKHDAAKTETKFDAVDYLAKKNAFLEKLSKGITSRTKATEVRKELDEIIELAKEVFRTPENEVLVLMKAYRTELDKAVATTSKKYQEAFEKGNEIKSEQYIDPTFTPELEAKVNALALSYVAELHQMHGQDSRKSDLYKKALATREGALALLKLPLDTLPSRIQSQALEQSKSPEAIAFEKEQKVKLEQISQQTTALYFEGFQYRTIAKKIDQAVLTLEREVATSEGKAV